MQEVKITKEQFDHINRFRYDQEKKYKYILNHVLGPHYSFTEDTVFITYNDTHNYYLVFDGEKLPSGKIQPTSITGRSNNGVR